MLKRVSLKDIADEAGVSIALVSYVLNGKNTKRINVDTAEKIKQIAKALNYQPNQIAKSLKNSKTHTIGLVVADISNFFYSYIAGFIEDEVNKYGYNVLFGSAYEDPKKFKNLLEIMVSRQVDGLILAIPDRAEDSVEYIQKLTIPVVIIDRQFPSFENLNTICLDNYRSSGMVVDKFHELGCKRIASIGLQNNLFHLHERSRGFVEEAQKYPQIEEVFTFNLSESSLNEDIGGVLHKAIYEDKIDAICCFTNKIAMATLPLLLSYDIKIPDNLAIICYDEVDAYKLFPHPMYYVRQPLKDMSVEAVRYLLSGKNQESLGTKKFQGDLIELKGY